MNIRRWAGTVAIPVLLAVLAGCGADNDGAGIATVGGGRAAGASATPSMDPEQARLKFAQCMRENGVDVRDPQPGRPGPLQFKSRGREGSVEAAMQKCRQYLQAGGIRRGPGPRERDAMLKFAQCMRANGVDVPDPKPGQGIKIVGEKGSEAAFKKAHEACQKHMLGGPAGKPAPGPAGGSGGR